MSEAAGLFRWRHARLRSTKVSLATGDIQVDAGGWFPPVLDPRDEARLRDIVKSGSNSYERVAMNSDVAYAERLKAAESNLAAAEAEVAKCESALQYALDVVSRCQQDIANLNAEKKRYQEIAEKAKAKVAEKAKAPAPTA